MAPTAPSPAVVLAQRVRLIFDDAAVVGLGMRWWLVADPGNEFCVGAR